MADQIVLQIIRAFVAGKESTLIQLQRAPNVGQDDGAREFDCDFTKLPPLQQPDEIRRHGRMLFESLTRSHEGVSKALQHALSLGAGSELPIYLQLKALPSAEMACWEALCPPAEAEPIALDQRWPVGRIAGSPQLGQREAEAYDPPLRMMVILSARSRDATAEWEGLYRAVKQARDDGLPISLKVATSQEDLQDSIRALNDSDLSLFALQSLLDLVQVANAFEPHLIHFFCHGSTSFNNPRVLLSTTLEPDTDAIALSLNDLLASSGIRDSWLAVLNCCEGGAASEDVHSLTHSLVARGVGAAIGMKEAVNELDAFEFSARLYPTLFDRLSNALESLKPGEETTIDWSGVLWAPRTGLKGRKTGNGANPVGNNENRAWILPVLYVQPDPLRIRRGNVAPAGDRARNRVIEDVLAQLPEALRADFLAELAAVREGR